MGYVSRLLEIGKLIPAETSHAEKTICTISLPWLGELSRNVILSLHEAARDIGPGRGKLNVYVPETNAEEINKLFMDLPHCIVKPISDGYIRSLLNSQSAVIYGGYNSVLDVIAAGIPALVILRSTRDGEQQEHLLRLQASVGGNLQIIEEDKVSGQRVKKLLQDLMARTPSLSADINCCGAERTAKYLHNILMENK